ncbi:MAG: acetylxylan esterase [Fimbriimonadaceae bacterium]|nr:acetylxylan esterase [Fimbriimonadaceae bacterium]
MTAATAWTPAATARRNAAQASALESWLDRGLAASAAARQRRAPRCNGDLEAWLAALAPLRARLIARLGLDRLPAATAPGLQRQRLAERLERWVWQPWTGAWGEALVLHPAATAAPRPVVVLTHALTSSPEAALGLGGPGRETALARALAARGAVVVVPRLVSGWPARLRLTRKARLAGLEWLGIETLMVQRLLDAVAGEADLDADRLAAVGFSRGGQVALHLAALDDRLSAVALASWFSQRATRLLADRDGRQACYLNSPEEEQFVPGWLLDFTDVQLAWLATPTPLFVSSGLDDPVVPWEQVQACFEPVAAVYAQLGLGDLAELLLHPAGHALAVAETVDFLARWLELSAAGAEFRLDASRPAGTTRPRLSGAAQARRRRARRARR